ncbi:hypothetical protein CCR80_00855 [Rhodothalassium salexigens]|nr:hypothetical protein [Rhodothalassium salexigens]
MWPTRRRFCAGSAGLRRWRNRAPSGCRSRRRCSSHGDRRPGADAPAVSAPSAAVGAGGARCLGGCPGGDRRVVALRPDGPGGPHSSAGDLVPVFVCRSVFLCADGAPGALGRAGVRPADPGPWCADRKGVWIMARTSRAFRQMHAIHAWTGAVTALALYVVMLTGAVAVFARHDLAAWADPAVNAEADPGFSAERALRLSIARFQAETGAPAGSAILFFPQPGAARAHVSVMAAAEDGAAAHDGVDYRLDAGRVTDASAVVGRAAGDTERLYQTDWTTPLGSFLVHLHTDLWLPPPWGRYLTGLLGLTLLISAVSGLVIHRRLLRDALLLRWPRGRSARWREAHKSVGAWGLLFNLMIGLTGTLLSFAAALLLPIVAVIGFGGDVAEAERVFVGIPPAAGVERPTADLDRLMADVSTRSPGFRPAFLHVHHLDDAAAVVDVTGFDRGAVSQAKYRFDGATGTFRSRLDGLADDAALSKTLAMLLSLHFGNFGGGLVKAAWALLGVASAGLVLSGLMSWVERRGRLVAGPVGSAAGARLAAPWQARAGRPAGALAGTPGRAPSGRGYGLLARLAGGVGVGVPLGLAGVMAAAHPMAALTPSTAATTGALALVFWSLVALACALAIALRPLASVLGGLLTAVAICLLAAVVARGFLAGVWPWHSLAEARWSVVMTDLVLVGLSGGLAWAGLRLARLGLAPRAAGERVGAAVP